MGKTIFQRYQCHADFKLENQIVLQAPLELQRHKRLADRRCEEDTGNSVFPPEQVFTRLELTFLGVTNCKDCVALYRVVMAEGNKFFELTNTFNHYAERLSRKLGGYLEDQTAKGSLRVEKPRQADHKFLAMLTMPILMELTIGDCGPLSDKEIGGIVDASVSTFLREFMG